jgi:protein-tyrosine phosphatase
MRAAYERVEVACSGGLGRTGTALACLAVLDGVPAGDAVAFVRGQYHPRAVETPWQRATCADSSRKPSSSEAKPNQKSLGVEAR